jgi:peptidoglycan/xylan/chitin deacetylase (PgdA/CDA1 family)
MKTDRLWLAVLLLVLAACSGQTQEVLFEFNPVVIKTDDILVSDTALPAATETGLPEEPALLVSTEKTVPAETTPFVVSEDSAANAVPEPPPRPPNEIGDILIIMYHGIDDDPGQYDRTASEFIRDLQGLYERGYRLISLHDLMDGHIDVAAGYSPVVLTFDDAKSTAFSLTERDGELVPAAGSALEILERFCDEYPDFGRGAVFFVPGRWEPFAGAGTVEERFDYLARNGYEIGNHSWNHPDFSRLNAAQLQEEIGRTEIWLREVSPGFTVRSIAYPGGARPVPRLRHYALEGEYRGATYQYTWALRAAPTMVSTNPFHIQFDSINVARVRATDDSTAAYAVSDLWYHLRLFDREPERRFVSDGCPDTLTVPERLVHWVNREALGALELVVVGDYNGYTP